VLQAMILTQGKEMVLTPTYHVFRMYNVHQNATYIPLEYEADGLMSLSASRDDAGTLHLSLVNPSLTESVTLEFSFDALRPRAVSGEILTARDVSAYNDFGKAPAVAPAPFKGCKLSGGQLRVTLPAASIVVLTL
jgi:alpha-N-arabinofuranosidase